MQVRNPEFVAPFAWHRHHLWCAVSSIVVDSAAGHGLCRLITPALSLSIRHLSFVTHTATMQLTSDHSVCAAPETR